MEVTVGRVVNEGHSIVEVGEWVLVFEVALLEDHLCLTIKTLLDVQRAKSLQYVWVFQGLSSEAWDSYRFNISFFSLFSSLQHKVTVADVAYTFQISLIFAKNPLERFKSLFIAAFLQKNFAKGSLELQATVLFFNKLYDFLGNNAHWILAKRISQL